MFLALNESSGVIFLVLFWSSPLIVLRFQQFVRFPSKEHLHGPQVESFVPKLNGSGDFLLLGKVEGQGVNDIEEV